MNRFRSTEFWTGVSMLGIAVLVMLVLIPFGVIEPKKVKFAALSPSYYPRIVAICLAVLGFIIAVRAGSAPELTSKDSEDKRSDAQARYAGIFLLLLGIGFLLNWLGFVLIGTISLATTIWFAGERRIWLITTLALVVPLALYFFFLKVAAIPIPLGVLQPILGGI